MGAEQDFYTMLFLFISSEGALYVILPYDYTFQLFEHTPALDNNLNINAMMIFVTIITIRSEITEIT